VWQGRFYSCPLDDAHLWAALRYTERNLVWTSLVQRAEAYAWSSAAAHCGTALPDRPIRAWRWNRGDDAGRKQRGATIWRQRNRKMRSRTYAKALITAGPGASFGIRGQPGKISGTEISATKRWPPHKTRE
jgi:hypothetical protein